MTHTEQRFIQRAMRRALPKVNGAPEEFSLKFIMDEISAAVVDAAEEDAGRLGADVGFVGDRAKLPQPMSGNGPIRTYVAPPTQQEDGIPEYDDTRMPDADPALLPKTPIIPPDNPPSLILLPGQEGFATAKKGRKLVGTPEPLKVYRKPKYIISDRKFQHRWQAGISALVELIRQKMPPIIKITPDGTSLQMDIEQLNIQSDIFSGMVKVEYGIGGQSGSSRSSGSGQKVGHATQPDQMEAMRLSILVTSTFSIEDTTVNWEQRIADIVANAEDAFRPRAKEIENRTPAKTGPVELLLSGDPRSNAGGYGEVSGDTRAINPYDERSGGALVLGNEQKPAQRRTTGPIVPSL